MAQLPGACGLRESHQGVEERLRVEQFIRHRSCTGLCHAGLQPDECVPIAGQDTATLTTLHQQVLAVGALAIGIRIKTNCCLPSHDDDELDLRDYGLTHGHPPVLPVPLKIG